ncbi:hypothetical protein GDO86_010549 [Hymenochirus boettgeri]|uniref:Uncharacterized protein n=1 Tax=Hymenochirus boettgeri TaxID=247094 RepID=A0A8T2JNH5_9PIPI|nr:hypothetical protein GDO86_010549 [Hymenochirus boettgeri]
MKAQSGLSEKKCRSGEHTTGILFSNGDRWKVMRKFTISKFKDLGVGNKIIENKINEECDFLVEKIKSIEGKPFELIMIISGALANIIMNILLGQRFDYQDPIFLHLLDIIDKGSRLLASPMVMEKNDNESIFHNYNLKVLSVDLLGAGTETASNTLRWGLLLMMKYPDIQKNVQIEIEKVIGLNHPQGEHRKSMPYTDAVIHEIQKFGTIAPIPIPRATTQEVTFRGYHLPKGTYVMSLLASVLRDKDHFEKPDEFYPEHFLDPQGNFVKRETFIPFSIGKRRCAGETLAKMELFLFFTRLLQNFTFQPPPGAVLDLTPASGLTSPPLPYDICAVPRI